MYIIPPNPQQREDAPPNIQVILKVFTDEEVEALTATYSDETGEFIGIGVFLKSTGMFTSFAEPEKAEAIRLLDAVYKMELGL